MEITSRRAPQARYRRRTDWRLRAGVVLGELVGACGLFGCAAALLFWSARIAAAL